MKKVGIKFLQELTYEEFESFQYLLDYDFEYEDLEEYIKEKRVILLDIDEDDEEDRVEDLEVLTVLLNECDRKKIVYELYLLDDEWRVEELKNIC